MTTLLLRLCGPMQSWGTESAFEQRDAGGEPSKSGVIGLVAAALGRKRGASIADLVALRMGVRVVREGVIQSDFQTAGGTHHVNDRYGVARFDGSHPDTVLIRRYYLADADYIVGLSGDGAMLQQIDTALLHPVWPLCLGRSAYVPSLPIAWPGGGLREVGLREALLAESWPDGVETTRCVYDEDAVSYGALEERHDVPLSFARPARYIARMVRVAQEVREEALP